MNSSNSPILECSKQGKVWHPVVKKCMTREEYQTYEQFYGANSKAAKDAREKAKTTPTQPDMSGPELEIAKEVAKRAKR